MRCIMVEGAIIAIMISFLHIFRLIPKRIKLFHMFLELLIWNILVLNFIIVLLNCRLINKTINKISISLDLFSSNMLDRQSIYILDVNFNQFRMR